jgi:hypothetical protein
VDIYKVCEYGPCKVTEIPLRCLTQCEKAMTSVVKSNCYGPIKQTRQWWNGDDWTAAEFHYAQLSSGIFFSCSGRFSFLSSFRLLAPLREDFYPNTKVGTTEKGLLTPKNQVIGTSDIGSILLIIGTIGLGSVVPIKALYQPKPRLSLLPAQGR